MQPPHSDQGAFCREDFEGMYIFTQISARALAHSTLQIRVGHGANNM